MLFRSILRYLEGTQELGLWDPRGNQEFLWAYSDADHAGYKTDRKSISGQCAFLRGGLVSWASKKQTCVSLSSTEAEYIAAASCCAQVLWLKNQLRDLGLEFPEAPILCDNTSTISLAKNPVQHTRTKHIDVTWHQVRRFNFKCLRFPIKGVCFQ